MYPLEVSDSTDLSQTRPLQRSRPRNWSLVDSMESHPGRYLVVFTAVFAFAEICSAARRVMFFDEMMNCYLGDLPSIRQIWTFIGQGIELNPPLPFWITWVIRHTMGTSDILPRVPAIAGFWLMCICLYHLVRRRSDVLHGFIALLLPVFTYAAGDATFARGYGLLLGASAAAILSWQLATDGVRRPLALSGLAGAIAVAISCHYYALYIAGAVALGEIVRTKTRRKIDPGVWIALALGISPLAVYASLVRSAAAGASSNFWISPLPLFLYESYADLLGPVTIVVGLFLAIVLSTSGKQRAGDGWIAPTVRPHEIAVYCALGMMPLALFLASEFSLLPFFSRYVQPVVIGFSALVGLFAYSAFGGHARIRKQLVSLLIWLCFFPWALYQMAKYPLMKPPAQQRLSNVKLPLQGAMPIVIESESDFLELYHYGSPEMRSKIFTLLDRAASVQFRGSDTAQRSIRIAQSFRELHTVPYADFVRQHREFLVARMRVEGWLVQKLLADGARVELLSLDKERGYFVQDSFLFHVQMPGDRSN